MAFELLGYDDPLGDGSEAGPVAPVGRRNGRLVAITYSIEDRAVTALPLDAKARFIRFTSEQRLAFEGFDEDNDRLFNLGSWRVVRYPLHEERLFFRRQLKDPAFSRANPYLRLSVAWLTENETHVRAEAERCLAPLSGALRKQFVREVAERLQANGMDADWIEKAAPKRTASRRR